LERHVWVSTGKTENIWMVVVESQYQVSSKDIEDFIYVFACWKTLYLKALTVSETADSNGRIT
jgi:hypothetical protein